jgi:hypothetical protein
MTVDHSYSEYEAIRTYHDRGMMKWGALRQESCLKRRRSL